MDYCPGTNCYYTSSSDGSSSATKININGGGKEKKTSVKKGKGGGVKLSTDPQSVAARERRHRISDRFKILQSLVPGGTKMDTVSMLEEAIHYVKFLKTQIWLHQTMINLNADDDVIIPSPSSSLSPPSPYVCLDDNNPVLPAAAATGSGFATVSASADQYAQYYNNNNNFSTNYSAAVQVQPSSSSMAVPYPDSYNCFQGQETMPMNNIEAYMKYYS